MLCRLSSLVLLGSSLLLMASSGRSQDAKIEVLEVAPKKLPSSVTTTTSGCCDVTAREIIIEVPPPEIIIQRAGGICCPPEPKGFLQRCSHFKMHQWTHISSHGHGGAPISCIPSTFVPQSFVPQSFAPQ